MAKADYQGFMTTFPSGDPTTDFNVTVQDCPNDNQIFCQAFAVPGSGTQDINEIGAYLYGGLSLTVRFALYTESGGSPSAIVSNSVTPVVNVTTTPGWFSYEYSTKPQVTSGVTYYICVWGNSAGGYDLNVYVDANTVNMDYATATYAATGDPSPGAWSAKTNRDAAWVAEYQAAGGVTLDQKSFRYRNDDGDEDAATWLASQGTDITRAKNLNTRLRMLLQATGNPDSAQYQLEYKKSTDSVWSKVV